MEQLLPYSSSPQFKRRWLAAVSFIPRFNQRPGAYAVESYSMAFAIVFAAWMAVVCRLAALVLIDIASFPAITPMYISYAYPLSCYASLISIFLVARWLSLPGATTSKLK